MRAHYQITQIACTVKLKSGKNEINNRTLVVGASNSNYNQMEFIAQLKLYAIFFILWLLYLKLFAFRHIVHLYVSNVITFYPTSHHHNLLTLHVSKLLFFLIIYSSGTHCSRLESILSQLTILIKPLDYEFHRMSKCVFFLLKRMSKLLCIYNIYYTIYIENN